MSKYNNLFADSPTAMACFFLALKITTYSSGTRSRNSRDTRPLMMFVKRGLVIDPSDNFIFGPIGAKKSFKLYLHKRNLNLDKS